MNKKVQIYVYFFLMLVLIPITTQAQELTKVERTEKAKQAIEDLEGGTLVLRLKSKNNKISKLEELMASPTIKDETKNKLRKELENTIDERNRYNLSLTNAFEEHYKFSDIYYIYDTASLSLKKGARSGIFLNKNLELDPSISIPDGTFFVIRTGTTDSSTTTGVEALVIMDQNLKDLVRPFPYYVRVNSISRLFTRVFNHKKLVRKDSNEIVQKLERNLRKYAALAVL